jgi:hypothetical protein
LRTDRATFEIAHKPDSRPNVITLDKFKDSEGTIDHLQCDERLDIQFQRKNKTGASASVPTTNAVRQANARPDGPAENLEIQSAHAIGKEVIISSDAEMLDAHGTDLVYDRAKQLTTLKGTPMWAIKEGTEIRAAELQLVNAKDHQQGTRGRPYQPV